MRYDAIDTQKSEYEQKPTETFENSRKKRRRAKSIVRLWNNIF